MSNVWLALLICTDCGYDGKLDGTSPRISIPAESRNWATEAECFASMKNWVAPEHYKRACWKFSIEPEISVEPNK